MYCYNCGEELTDDARFCAQCGTMVEDETGIVADNADDSNQYVDCVAVSQVGIDSCTQFKSVNDAEIKIEDNAENLNRCSTCGAVLSDDLELCFQCGTMVRKRSSAIEDRKANYILCYNCGTELPSDAKLCLVCGVKMF